MVDTTEEKKPVIEPPPAAPTTASDAAPAPAAATEHINLKVVGQDGSEVFFKIKRNTPLRKLMDAYCQRQAITSNSIRFLYDGQRIQPDRTPSQMNMEDNDIIDAMLTQTGGC